MIDQFDPPLAPAAAAAFRALADCKVIRGALHHRGLSELAAIGVASARPVSARPGYADWRLATDFTASMERAA
ncbi:hypothetical protein [Croceicoccus sp. BE223]|uniref:hypothetical protein n=1 Tax=Croceicoccus sp. BE223 TaxID=2817716 RepID=UPI0028674012|nr:hypothetical protein [Croceicoccus sp. BE223]MDR7101440.1 hypothetical protein [Croceicoccus sp. BE223]